MTIIVTGGAGFIGSNFVFHMLKEHEDYRIICLDKLTYAGNLSTLKSVMDNPNFRFVKADICDREAVEKLFEEEKPDIVVIGFDTELTYEKLNKACNYIAQGSEYIVTHPDVNCPLKDGFMPDVGSYMALIKASTGREPDLIMGKPYAYTVDYVTNRIGCKREEVAFVGDRLETDIAIGVKNGLKAVLVYTGVTTPEMYEKSDIKATAAFENIGELGKALI